MRYHMRNIECISESDIWQEINLNTQTFQKRILGIKSTRIHSAHWSVLICRSYACNLWDGRGTEVPPSSALWVNTAELRRAQHCHLGMFSLSNALENQKGSLSLFFCLRNAFVRCDCGITRSKRGTTDNYLHKVPCCLTNLIEIAGLEMYLIKVTSFINSAMI